MSRDKKHRSERSQDDRPASTDLADVIEDDASREASDHQRKRPTAGPSESDRFGEGKVAADAQGRIIKVDVVGGQTMITIGLGAQQGVHEGMEGYVKDGDGMAAEFSVFDVKERTAHAFVSIPVGSLHQYSHVVVNPASMPKAPPVKDQKVRIIGISVEGGRTKILIGLGSNHGARGGMKGHLVDDSGRAHADFVIAEEHPGHSVAYVDEIVDQVRAHPNAVINPS
jgi:hypothetical protein